MTMKRQKIFYYYNGVKVDVKPKLLETDYKFKLGERDLFVLTVPLNDSDNARKVVNNYIDRLELN